MFRKPFIFANFICFLVFSSCGYNESEHTVQGTKVVDYGDYSYTCDYSHLFYIDSSGRVGIKEFADASGKGSVNLFRTINRPLDCTVCGWVVEPVYTTINLLEFASINVSVNKSTGDASLSYSLKAPQNDFAFWAYRVQASCGKIIDKKLRPIRNPKNPASGGGKGGFG